MVVHRLTGDGAKRDLLAPLWSGDKKRVLNAIHQAFLRDNLIQGSHFAAGNDGHQDGLIGLQIAGRRI